VVGKTYPTIHKNLKKETTTSTAVVSLEGIRPILKPVLLASHLDVVPVMKQPCLPGMLIHSKVNQTGLYLGTRYAGYEKPYHRDVRAIEKMLADGFQPSAIYYLGLGTMKNFRQERCQEHRGCPGKAGHQMAAVLYEGGMISHGLVPGVELPVG
jgi:hypothetical protein